MILCAICTDECMTCTWWCWRNFFVDSGSSSVRSSWTLGYYRSTGAAWQSLGYHSFQKGYYFTKIFPHTILLRLKLVPPCVIWYSMNMVLIDQRDQHFNLLCNYDLELYCWGWVVFRLWVYLQELIHFRHLPLLACMDGSLFAFLLSHEIGQKVWIVLDVTSRDQSNCGRHLTF